MNKLVGSFTLKSPLSHISETISSSSYLCQEPILQPDKTISEVFCYSGNAWRGQLRDLAASYMLDILEEKLSLDPFHLLFSGGKIGGDQKVDIEHIRMTRKAVPMLALFGGGLGNVIMPGLMRVGNCYPICQEAKPALPNFYWSDATLPSYADLTFEKEFTRTDDVKNEELLRYAKEMPAEKEKSKKVKVVSDQMRMSAELVCAGAALHTYIDFLDDSEVYLGVLLSALKRFAELPFIGGQHNKGHGLVTLEYKLNGEEFFSASDNQSFLSGNAETILSDYDQTILERQESIIGVLK